MNMTLIQVSKKGLADEVEQYIERRVAGFKGEAEAAHRSQDLQDHYLDQMYEWMRVGREIVEWLRSQ